MSVKRKNLISQEDYDKVFSEYRDTVLKAEKSELDSLAEMVNSGKRLAFTCYEANPAQCHRTLVAEEVSKLTGVGVQLL